MFGHDDQPQHQHDANQQATGGLTTDDGQILSAPHDPAPVDDTAGDFIDTDTPTAPAPAVPQPAEDVSVPAPVADAPVGGHPNADHLLDIKQQALQQLSPLIGHLDQDPEEKFRTTMMMIQAADNDTLIKDAYEAALQIQDEKVRAQALLDIVNEINYFTHNNAAAEAQA
jgi:hypothetical protein